MLDTPFLQLTNIQNPAIHLSSPRGESDPRDLRDELFERCEGNVGVCGVARSGVRGERGERRIADQKHIEILRKIFVAGGCLAEAHVGGVAGQQDVSNSLLFEKIPQRLIAFRVVDDDIVHGDVELVGKRVV